MKQSAWKVASNARNEDPKAGSSKDFNESKAVEHNEKPPAAGQFKGADGSDDKNKNVLKKIKEEAGLVKAEETSDRNVGADIRLAWPFLEEPETRYRSQPMDHSFSNSIAEPFSVDLHGFASSSRHVPRMDNMAGRWNNAMPVSNNFGNSYFPPPVNDRAAGNWSNQWPHQWRSNQNQSYPHEASFQGDFNRSWQNPYLPVYGNPYYATGWPRPAAYPPNWGMWEPPFAAGYQPQAGYSNSYENSQYDQANARRPQPDPWELQKAAAFTNRRNQFRPVMASDPSPSRNPTWGNWPPATPQQTTPVTDGFPSTSFARNKEYKLFPQGENPFGVHVKPKEEVKKKPVKIETLFGEVDGNGEVIYKCQMCDSIVEKPITKGVLYDRRYCADCVGFVHGLWNERR